MFLSLWALALGCNQTITGVSGDEDGGGGGGSGDLRPGFNRDGACAAARSEAGLTKKPVDIIMVIDNSGSMTEEIIAVEKNINNNFADIIGKSGLDYRVILISKHGKSSSQQICISKPLSGADCSQAIPTKPANTARFFQYNTSVASTDSFAVILDTYTKAEPSGAAAGGWSQWLRPEAYRVFLEITDDDANTPGNPPYKTFEERLLALQPLRFGTAAQRNYTFHSICGVKENTPPSAPWKPTDAYQDAKCTGGSVNNGDDYQRLSMLTGGLRFPICQYASFDAVFKTIADGVVQSAQVACDFPIPAAPAGQKVDLETVLVEYQAGGVGVPTQFTKALNQAACAPGQFYIANDRIQLCPATCQTVQKDVKAKLEVLFDCALIVN